MILGVGNDSCFYIDGIPYQRGHVIPMLDSANGKCSFRYRESIKNEIDGFGNLPYSSYTDASTGNPFASFNDLVAWIVANVFAGIVSGGTGSGLAYSKVFYIVAAPAADNEKAAGATFQDDWLIDASITCLIYNNALAQPPFNNFTSGTGTLGLNEGNWELGDTITIFKA